MIINVSLIVVIVVISVILVIYNRLVKAKNSVKRAESDKIWWSAETGKIRKSGGLCGNIQGYLRWWYQGYIRQRMGKSYSGYR